MTSTRSSPLVVRSEEHTSELQSLRHLVCRLLLEKKNPGGRCGSTSACWPGKRSEGPDRMRPGAGRPLDRSVPAGVWVPGRRDESPVSFFHDTGAPPKFALLPPPRGSG